MPHAPMRSTLCWLCARAPQHTVLTVLTVLTVPAVLAVPTVLTTPGLDGRRDGRRLLQPAPPLGLRHAEQPDASLRGQQQPVKER